MTGTGIVVVLIAALGVAACGSRPTSAPVVDRAAPRAAPAASAVPAAPFRQAAPEGFYMVKRGDTLYSIALDHGADYRELAQWNGLDDATRISVGQMLRVKPLEERRAQIGNARVIGRIESRPIEATPRQGRGDGATRTEPKALRLPYSSENAALLARSQAQPGAGDSGFIWPVKGKLLAGFSEPRSKGIDIDGNPGDPVVAAAAGRVTYIGSGIPGLGKLVVIKHDNGFITVYAHNSDILVKEQQSVSRGEKIAELGSTDADRPKLHFQIRKGSAPVDPLRYLPGL